MGAVRARVAAGAPLPAVHARAENAARGGGIALHAGRACADGGRGNRGGAVSSRPERRVIAPGSSTAPHADTTAPSLSKDRAPLFRSGAPAPTPQELRAGVANCAPVAS